MTKPEKPAKPESDHDRMTKSGRLRIEEIKRALESPKDPPPKDKPAKR
jgi:hypothetical protein